MSDALRPSDAELYSSFLGGETTSYDQLMVRYGDSLTFFLFGYLHDWEEAEDLMIEAFARIMAKRPRIAEGAFKAYLFRTGRNLALRSIDRRRRIVMFSVDGMDKEAAETYMAREAGAASDADGIPEMLVRDEEAKILRKCLERIEPELREAMWLVYMEQMTYAQAAKVMGVKEKRVDRLLTRGKQQMRKELEKEGITNENRHL
jgi:RNA polymerase sigma-70 factor (ECF subfamily)